MYPVAPCSHCLLYCGSINIDIVCYAKWLLLALVKEYIFYRKELLIVQNNFSLLCSVDESEYCHMMHGYARSSLELKVIVYKI